MTIFPTKLTKKQSHHFKLGVVRKKKQGRFLWIPEKKQHPFFPEKNLLDDFGYIHLYIYIYTVGSLDVFCSYISRVVSRRS